jgi:acyl-coenzyme A thioesterase PaaI-like protein
MHIVNPLRTFADNAMKKPLWLRFKILTWVFRYKVKLVGTCKIDIKETDLKSVTFIVKNRKKVQNHIGSVHAATMALIAESATGFVVGVNLPGDKLPLIKSMNLKYVKRAYGDMQATATLTDEQIRILQNQPKGDFLVDVKVTDQSGDEPVIAEMHWAWVPKAKN